MKPYPPTFTGAVPPCQPVNVGGTIYGVEQGSRIAHVAMRRFCYVLTPDGVLHCLNAQGEVEIPKRLVRRLIETHFPPT